MMTVTSRPAAALTLRGCRIFTGTSGYSYGEWVDAGIYPEGTHAANMLPAYANRFGATELNYTWYQMPRAAAVERMTTQVPEGFKFAVKLTRTLTHEVHSTQNPGPKSGQWIKEVMAFRQGIAPITEKGMLLAVLVQLPPYFQRTPPLRAYLAALLDELSGLPVAVEFRHPSWAHDRVFEEFARRRITLVTVDAPDLPRLFPRIARVTCPDLFYVRLHGRNSQGWRSGKMQKQFDYDYDEQELRELAALIKKMAPEAAAGAVFFNNHVRGQAPRNSLRLAAMLAEPGPS